ncbi:hypothetical protein [Algoriphagus marinus]|uniref:hypothetical protein n=1 Tax=Algoriphagus marinus TaxID=1925762 RepID=UPI00094BC4C4|nr:hypothetical protein [Algoriphagus marinus]
MKDQLNEHTPRTDSWEKILGKMSFENQLEGHLQNLPQFEPNADSWEKIIDKLEDKKRISLWPFLGLAAGIIGILLISKFAWNETETIELQFSDQNSLTEISVIDLPVQMKFQEESKSGISKTIPSISKPKKITETQEKELPEISVKVPDFEFIAIDKPVILLAEKDSLEEFENQVQLKTLHEVTISWGLKPTNFQVKTAFGKSDPVKLEEKQIGRSGRLGRIRFGQNN